MQSEARISTHFEETGPSGDYLARSQPGLVSSNMFERLLDGDLPKGKGMELNISTTGEEWVV